MQEDRRDPIMKLFDDALTIKSWFLYVPPDWKYEGLWKGELENFRQIRRSEWWRRHPLAQRFVESPVKLEPDMRNKEGWARIIKSKHLERGELRQPILLWDMSTVVLHTIYFGYNSQGYDHKSWFESENRTVLVVVKERYTSNEIDGLRSCIKNILAQAPWEVVRTAKLLKCVDELKYYNPR